MRKALHRAAWTVHTVLGALVLLGMLAGAACILFGIFLGGVAMMTMVTHFDADPVPEQTRPCPSERRWELTVYTLRIFFDTWRWVGTFPPCV